jgi:hypothetical protein
VKNEFWRKVREERNWMEFMGCDAERGCQRGSHILVYLLTARKLLLAGGL